ncbi:MAG: hypothetical protein ACERKZ_14300 [Lachnotalea sp.]
MKNLMSSLLAVCFCIISFCTFYYIIFLNSKKLNINNVIIQAGLCLVICIGLHESGHYIVGKYYKYSLLCVRVLGLQIRKTENLGRRYKVNFSLEWLVSGNVVFDYQKELNSEDSLDSFYERLRYILIGGPIVSALIIIVSLGCYLFLIIKDTTFLIILLINSMILVSGYFSNSHEINDIDAFFNISMYKDKLFYWICFNNNVSKNKYILDKKEILVWKLINNKQINVFEMMFICNTIWDMYEKDMINEKVNLKLCHAYKTIECSNIYYYYLMISMLVIINYKLNREKSIELYHYIQNRPQILFVLKEKSSGVSYFIYLMENTICNKSYIIKDSLIIKARKKIGLGIY